MKLGDRCYLYNEERIGVLQGTTIQSGYEMFLVDGELYYQNNVLNISRQFTNSELWNLVDTKGFPRGLIVIDQEYNEFIFTGKSFQIYSDHDGSKYKGFCKNDIWIIDRIVDFDEEMD